jgi:hypothetical protein
MDNGDKLNTHHNKAWIKLKPNEINFLHYKYVLRCYLRALYFYSLIQKNKIRTGKLISTNMNKPVGIGLVYRQDACEVAWLGQLNAILEFFNRKRLKPEGVMVTDTIFVKLLKERRDLDHHIIIDHMRRLRSGFDPEKIISFQNDLDKFILASTRYFLDSKNIGPWHFDWGPESKALYKRALKLKRI